MIRLSFKTRDIPKWLWKILWRQQRIVNRECKMAFEDMMIFGTGAVETGPRVPDFIRRVHPSNTWERLL